MTPSDPPDRPRLLAEDGFNPHLAYALKPFPVERSVVFEPSAGKPSLVKLPDGTLLASCIRGYPTHDFHWQIDLRRSDDGGKTWSPSVCAVPEDRHPGDHYLIVFDNDHLLLAFMSVIIADKKHPWQGPFLSESPDAGRSWSDPWPVDISAFCSGPFGAADRGHVVTPDGALFLFVGTFENPPRPYEFMMVSHDRGRTFSEWRKISDNSADGSFALAPSGDFVGLLRINADDYPHRGAHPELAERSERVHFMAFVRSIDHGRTWSTPLPITGWSEIPGHILPLTDGRLLATFGVRHYPLGIQALLTKPDGRTWDLDNRLVLALHGAQAKRPGTDVVRHSCGHPFTAQREDGRLFTVYYMMADPFDHKTFQIEGLLWDPPSA